MDRHINLLRPCLCLGAVGLMLLAACNQQMNDYYEAADYQELSAWETLEQDGNHQIFLQGIEKAGYKPYVKGKGITTVLAPTDSAFQVYMKAHGIGSLDDLSQDELKKLVGFHLLYYSYNKSKMANFRPEGQAASLAGTETDRNGLYYKFRSHSTSPVTTVVDSTRGKELTVYHLERFVPVFSNQFFETKGIEAKSNYEYFFPSSRWTGDDGFNISEASVTEYAHITCNGYIYYIDRVLDPLETIHTELVNNPDYSLFTQLYDGFSTYEYDATLSADYGDAVGVDSLYLHSHRSPLAPIALEWPVSDYQRLDTLAYRAYSVFAPSNQALNQFFDSYWRPGGYASLDDLDPLLVSSLLRECVYSGSLAFPDEITQGKILNSYGLPYSFQPDQVGFRKMCVNGSLYGTDHLDTPLLFESVAGPAFANRKYLCFLYTLSNSGLLGSFASQTQRYTMLLPSDSSYAQDNMYLNYAESGNQLQLGNDENAESISTATKQEIVRLHFAMGDYSLPASGTAVIPLSTAYTYWYVRNGKVTTNGSFNRLLEPEFADQDPFVTFEPVSNQISGAWNNGSVYTYGADEIQGLLQAESSTLAKKLANCEDNRYPYYAFARLLKLADLVSGDKISFLGSGRYILFAPSNEAVFRAISPDAEFEYNEFYMDTDLPGCEWLMMLDDGSIMGEFDTDVLRKFLAQFFVDASTISTCPYPGSDMKTGTYHSIGVTDEGKSVRYDLDYTDEDGQMSIRLHGSDSICHVIPDYSGFPFAFTDGSMQIIDNIIK